MRHDGLAHSEPGAFSSSVEVLRAQVYWTCALATNRFTVSCGCLCEHHYWRDGGVQCEIKSLLWELPGCYGTTGKLPRQKMNSAYQANPAPHPLSHWSDYGDILYNGMTSHLGREKDTLQLARTGPFVPDLFVSGGADILINDSVKRQLEVIIPSLVFVRVVKVHIIKMDWHTWDISAEEPLEYPEFGTPEDFILSREHDPALSALIGQIWEISPEIDADIQGAGGCFISSRYRGQHLVRANINAGRNFVSDELRSALQTVVPGRIEFIAPIKAAD